MMTIRYGVLAAALSLLPALIPVSYALRTSDAILLEQSSMLEETVCAKAGQPRGQCITDTLKRIKSLRDEFNRAISTERKMWTAEHGAISTATLEYQQALRAYLVTVTEKRRLFNEQERKIQKRFFEIQKDARRSASSSSSSSSSGDQDAAVNACADSRSEAVRRVCVRARLRVNSLSEARRAVLKQGAQ